MKIDQELIERLNRSMEFTTSLSAIGSMREAASRLQALGEEVDSLREGMDMLISAIGVAKLENAKLREALKPFAELSSKIPKNSTYELPKRLQLTTLSIWDLRRAQAALSTTDAQ